jgi:signal transduction histidine kinase
MRKELKQARLRLMLLYLGMGSLLVILIASLTYGLINHFLLSSVDGMLRQRMALLYQTNLAPLPADLSAALDPNEKNISPSRSPESQIDEADDHFEWNTSIDDEHAYASDLAGVFILPLDEKGVQLTNPNPFAPPIPADIPASQSALEHGSDLRTVHAANGTSYRLLTYPVPNGGSTVVIQMGKSLSEQQRLSSQLLLALVIIGAGGLAGLGFISWWLSDRALQPALQAWDQQQVFIANAGHELRTPLTILRSTMEIMLRSNLEEDQRKLVLDGIQECDHMNKLVEDLLLLSRLDHQRLSFEFTSMELQPLLEDVCKKMEPLTKNAGILLSCELQKGLVLGDPLRLRQVFLILLDNAIHNTPAGGRIEINTRTLADWMEITIKDSGLGIPAQDLPHVFERFYRVNRVSDKDYSGNGLGLSIAKSIIEAHRGTILLESEQNRGTAVVITLSRANLKAG